MRNIDIERVYTISNWVALVLAVVAFMGATVSNEISFWVPALIIATPTILFLFVALVSLVWSFFLTKETQ